MAPSLRWRTNFDAEYGAHVPGFKVYSVAFSEMDGVNSTFTCKIYLRTCDPANWVVYFHAVGTTRLLCLDVASIAVIAIIARHDGTYVASKNKRRYDTIFIHQNKEKRSAEKLMVIMQCEKWSDCKQV